MKSWVVPLPSAPAPSPTPEMDTLEPSVSTNVLPTIAIPCKRTSKIPPPGQSTAVARSLAYSVVLTFSDWAVIGQGMLRAFLGAQRKNTVNTLYPARKQPRLLPVQGAVVPNVTFAGEVPRTPREKRTMGRLHEEQIIPA